jgi:preprotein translocase subunit SecA
LKVEHTLKIIFINAQDMNAPAKPYYKQELLRITYRYHKIVTTWSGYTEKDTEKGISAPPDFTTKTGRNDPCPCGSGNKYKKCYL